MVTIALVVVITVMVVVIVVIAVVTMPRQMREMRGNFFLNPLLDVVSVNVKMLVIFLDVDNLDRWGRVAQVRPRVCRMRN